MVKNHSETFLRMVYVPICRYVLFPNKSNGLASLSASSRHCLALIRDYADDVCLVCNIAWMGDTCQSNVHLADVMLGPRFSRRTLHCKQINVLHFNSQYMNTVWSLFDPRTLNWDFWLADQSIDCAREQTVPLIPEHR